MLSIIHIDIDAAAISKIIKVDIPIVGDAKRILTAFNEIVKPRTADGWNEQVNNWKGERLFTYTKSDQEIKPQAVIEAVYNETNGNAIITTEVGQHQMWTAQYFIFNRPRTLLTSGGLGTMGFGMPAAMGAAFASNDKPVIVIAGDGSIQMNIQELATLSMNNIPVKIVILNNSYLGMVRQWQELFYNKRYSSTCLRGGTLRATIALDQISATVNIFRTLLHLQRAIVSKHSVRKKWKIFFLFCVKGLQLMGQRLWSSLSLRKKMFSRWFLLVNQLMKFWRANEYTYNVDFIGKPQWCTLPCCRSFLQPRL